MRHIWQSSCSLQSLTDNLMTDLRVWKFLSPNPDPDKEHYNPQGAVVRAALYTWAKCDGKSRFGWSTHSVHDLNWADEQVELALGHLESTGENLKTRRLDRDTVHNWREKAKRLKTEIRPGDWIIHINVPRQNKFLAVQVNGVYGYDRNDEVGDFRHFIPVDPSTAWESDRATFKDHIIDAALYTRHGLERVGKTAALEALRKYLIDRSR